MNVWLTEPSSIVLLGNIIMDLTTQKGQILYIQDSDNYHNIKTIFFLWYISLYNRSYYAIKMGLVLHRCGIIMKKKIATWVNFLCWLFPRNNIPQNGQEKRCKNPIGFYSIVAMCTTQREKLKELSRLYNRRVLHRWRRILRVHLQWDIFFLFLLLGLTLKSKPLKVETQIRNK